MHLGRWDDGFVQLPHVDADDLFIMEVSASSITASTFSDLGNANDHSNASSLTNVEPKAMFLKTSRTNSIMSSALPSVGDGYTRREADNGRSHFLQTKDVTTIETNNGTWTSTNLCRSNDVLMVFEGAVTPPGGGGQTFNCLMMAPYNGIDGFLERVAQGLSGSREELAHLRKREQ